MGRLIDADLLIERIYEYQSKAIDTEDVIHSIKTMPKAFDASEVVKQIQDKCCQKCRNILGVAGAEEYCKEQKCRIDEICDIVRKGGVE